MKKLGFILGFIGICVIGYYAFPIAIVILKIVIGLAFLSIFGVGYLIGQAKRK